MHPIWDMLVYSKYVILIKCMRLDLRLKNSTMS